MDVRRAIVVLGVFALVFGFGCKKKVNVGEEFGEEATTEDVRPADEGTAKAEAEPAEKPAKKARARDEETYSGNSHKVVWGDTLADITWKYLHGRANFHAVLKVNSQITDPNLIICGDTITIPEI
jgi:nucleoid-associated protein YgaU